MKTLIVGALVALFVSFTTPVLADQEPAECANRAQVLEDMGIIADRGDIGVILHAEITGPAAMVFAMDTGWQGEVIDRIMLFAAVSPDGNLMPAGMVVIFSQNTGCSVASKMLELERAKTHMDFLEARSQA